MIRRAFAWVRRHRVKAVLASLLAGAIGFNLAAWMHARAMTHFSASGERTPGIEELGFLGKVRAVAFGVTIPKPVNRSSPADFQLDFSTHRCTARDGVGLEVWLIPAERSHGVVVAVHGYAGAKSQVLPAARVFRQLGYDVVLVDLRAAGGSGGRVTTLGYEEARDVAAAAAFAARIRPGRPLVLYGYSMGGAAVARAVAEEGVRPAAVVLEGTFSRMLDTVANRFRMMGLPVFPAAHALVFWGGVQLGFDGFDHDPVDYARGIRCPLLLLAGTNDRRAPLAGARAIGAAAAGPVTLHVFTGAAHDSPVASQEAAWRGAVGAFLEAHVFAPLSRGGVMR